MEISTPLIMNKQLWKTSGHWDHYKDNMYSTIIDDEEYCIKPMNCPGGVLVYASKPHSYRELPIRAGEIGLVHRHELRGALHGLFRVRCFNQDDAHLFVRPDQLTDELVGVVNLIDSVYQKFGFTYHLELSTRPEDSMGSDEDWAAAEEGLKQGPGAAWAWTTSSTRVTARSTAPRSTSTWRTRWAAPGSAAPCSSTSRCRSTSTWSTPTPTAPRSAPSCCTACAFGSIERFIGILIEHFAGKFPTWLAPCQVKVLPVSEKSRDYARTVTERLEAAGIRAVLDERDEKIGYKIRDARNVDRPPYMLILGEQEVEAGNISVRDRSNETHVREIDEFIADVCQEIAERR